MCALTTFALPTVASVAEKQMVESFDAKYCSLHVRESNYGAFHLYRDTLKFTYVARWRGGVGVANAQRGQARVGVQDPWP